MTSLQASARMWRRVGHVMGMPVSLALRIPDASEESGWTARAERAWEAAMASLADTDRVFSPFRTDSWVSRFGRGEVARAECPPEFAFVLELGERWKAESRGAFDVVREGVFDPSGVVKGWAADRAAGHLRVLDADFCLSVGGDIVCRAAREPWRIGIEDPADPLRVVSVVPLRTGGIATSGLVHRGGHITDARTGVVPRALASVTVVAASLVRADLDATAAFALGAEGPDWLRGRPGASSLVVYADGRVESVAPGLAGHLVAGQRQHVTTGSVQRSGPSLRLMSCRRSATSCTI